MAISKSMGTGAKPGLFESVRLFGSVLLAAGFTRLDLATVELEEQGVRVLQLSLAALAAFVCFSSAFFFFTLFIIVLLWEYKLIVIGVIFGVYLMGGAVFLAIARGMIATWPRFLGQTLTELRRDAETLRQAVVTTTEDQP